MGKALTTETQRHRGICFKDNPHKRQKKFLRLNLPFCLFSRVKKDFCLSLCLGVSVVNAFLETGRDVRWEWQPCS